MSDQVAVQLNDRQREAVETIDQHVRIIAGAGSGKTRVIVSRIEYLVNEAGIPPWRIMAITFTNKAAREMKERLQKSLEADAESLRVSTIHSLCVRILREDGHLLSYPKSFAILDADDQNAILRPIYKNIGVDRNSIPSSRALSYISNNKTAYVTPEQAMDSAYDADSQILAQIYEAYEKERLNMKAMDFDDLLIEAEELLKNYPAASAKWQRRLDYIHVDEFQDIDPIQYSIIRHITSPESYLCVVGDPDQTIYTWRGANVDIILRFEKDFPNTRTIILNQNYRSVQPILNGANALIQNNRTRIKKDLFSELPGDDLIEEYEGRSENDEPSYIIRQINALRHEGASLDEIAVLYRSNYLSRSLEKFLKNVKIPYTIYGGIRFFERAEIKDILSYLRLLARPDEDDPAALSKNLAFLRIINVPRRGIGQKTIEKVVAKAQAEGLNYYDALLDPTGMTKAVAAKLQKFVGIIEQLKESAASMSLPELIDEILDVTGYEDMIHVKDEQERLDNIKELKNDIQEALENNPDLTLEDYLQEVALFTDKSQEEQTRGVSLMTAHSAKGLEFDNVFIYGLNEGVFPSARALEENHWRGLEEERRLLYVAMTRARKRLFLTWNRDYSYFLDGNNTPSRFLKEIPDEFVHSEQKEREEARVYREVKTSNANSFSRHSARLAARSNMTRQKFRAGDLVEHAAYGQGVILEIKGNTAAIQFPKPVGMKKINAQHASLKKAGRQMV